MVPGFGQIYSGKKGSGFAILLLEAGMVGMAAKSNNDYLAFQTEWNTQLSNYNAATVPSEIADYKILVDQARSDMMASNDQLNLFIYASAGLWAVNTIHAFFVGPKNDDDDEEEASKSPPFQLAYSPLTNQVKLQWEIDL